MQTKDVALPGKEIVADVDALHRRQVAPDDRLGDERAQRPLGLGVLLDRFEGVFAKLHSSAVLGVEIGHARIQVPANVVEAFVARGERLHVVERLVLEVKKSDDDVRDLDAGVVDVVLHLDVPDRESGARVRTCRRAPRFSSGRCAPLCWG